MFTTGKLRALAVVGTKRTPALPDMPSIDRTAYECVTSMERLTHWIDRAFAARVVAIDTETSSLDAMRAELAGISLALGPNDACYIPLTHEHEPAANAGGLDFGEQAEAREPLTQIDKPTALARLKALLENPAVLKVGQNIKYDIAVMARRGINVAPYDDTMLISYVLEGGLHGHGMDELAQLHLGHEPIPFKSVAGTGKSQKSFKHVELKPATAYAAEDADVTLRLWRVLKPRLAAEGLLYALFPGAVREVLGRLLALPEPSFRGVGLAAAALGALIALAAAIV